VEHKSTGRPHGAPRISGHHPCLVMTGFQPAVAAEMAAR
jgi:hypothetical protein